MLTYFQKSACILLIALLFVVVSCNQDADEATLLVTTDLSNPLPEKELKGAIKIIKGAAVLWTNTNTEGATPTYTFKQMERLINAYWSDATKERKFPIALWQLNKLFDASPTSEIALRVTDIADRDQMDATWVSYNSKTEAQLPASKGDVYYFVFQRAYFDGPINLSSGEQIKGMSSVSNPSDHIVWARIGKSENNQYYAFFNVAESIITKVNESSRGDGTAGGFKIPSP
ncbi:MAG: hypothetical protein SFU99_13980 [Saprospiraceae bacterium]|nr:hypothetical protein [Saprospiraceae bacterium]